MDEINDVSLENQWTVIIPIKRFVMLCRAVDNIHIIKSKQITSHTYFSSTWQNAKIILNKAPETLAVQWNKIKCIAWMSQQKYLVTDFTKIIP